MRCRATITEARDSVHHLRDLVETRYQSMSSRLHALERRELNRMSYVSSALLDNDDSSTIRSTGHASIGMKLNTTHTPAEFTPSPEFLTGLINSRAYRKESYWRMSTSSEMHCATMLSFFSDLSLAEVSNISVINLVITIEDLYNPYRKSQTWSALDLGQGNQIPGADTPETNNDPILQPLATSVEQEYSTAASHSPPIEQDDATYPCKGCGEVRHEGPPRVSSS